MGTFEKGNCQLNLDMLTPSLPLSSDEGRSERARAANEFQIASDLRK